jgi:ABC-type bacteriocin/lantibiotic exporter with double-glycine peptidase domain
VLILDEPTSSVDINTEKEIMEATEALLHGRTTFMIAHRLSTVKNCDLLLVLKEGCLQVITSEFQVAMQELLGSTASSAHHIAPERQLVQ